jgi:hypothetical protein
MEWRARRAVVAVGVLSVGVGVGVKRAEAQLGGAPFPTPDVVGTTPATGTSALNANPFANPYANPFLNPYMAATSMPPGNAALYFFAAQQMNGGIGSGRIGGARPGPGGSAGTPASRANPAADKQAGGANAPGAGAARYFNRTYPTNLGTIPQYHRQTSHYPPIRQAR